MNALLPMLLCLALAGKAWCQEEYGTTFGHYNYSITLKPSGSNSKVSFWRQLEYTSGEGGWPVTYESEEEYQHVLRWLTDEVTELSSTEPVWIGLWSYLKPTYEWLDGSRGTVDHWAKDQGQPADAHRKKCVVQKNGLFYTEHCEGGKALVVWKYRLDGNSVVPTITPPSPGPCPPGYTAFADDPSRCFQIVTLDHYSGLTFAEAEAACLATAGYGELASVRTAYQTAQLLSLMDLKVTGYWLGLYKESWYALWIDNSPSPSSVSNYANCGELVYQSDSSYKPGDLKWADCGLRKGYICQTTAGNPGDTVPSTPPPEVVCPDGYEAYRQGCYRAQPEKQTWETSLSYCGRKHVNSSLVAIHSINENAFVQKYTLSLGSPIWIGLHTVVTDSDPRELVWSNNWETVFVNWKKSPGFSSGCVFMDTAGTWDITDCRTEYPSVCEIPMGESVTIPPSTGGFCPPDYQGKAWMEHGEQCYYVVNTGDYGKKSTWLESLESCLEIDRHALLATIHNEATAAALVKETNKNAYYKKEGVWIGLYKNKDGAFAWLDGSPIQYQNWASGFPDYNSSTKQCVYMETNDDSHLYHWKDAPCEDPFGTKDFACMVNKEPKPVPPKSNGDPCPDDNWEHYGEECFLFASNVEEPRERAEQICQQTPGAELVSIGSAEEDQYVRAMLYENNRHTMHRDFWLGLKVKAGGDLEWDNRASTSYTNFYPGEPPNWDYGDQCVTLETVHGLWVTQPCALSKGFACRVHKSAASDTGLSDGEIAGILFGTIVATILLVGALFFGLVVLLKKKEVKLPYGFDNALYGLVDI